MWFNHPKYIQARKNFTSEFSPWRLTYLHYSIPKVIFICGGKHSNYPNRSIIEKYFTKHIPTALTFRAEDAWEIISKAKSTNALELEEWLADFSDIVIILVESFGTVTELGAFALSPTLRLKLLPVLNDDYSKEESFINTGPIQWVNKDSKYKPAIQANFKAILTCIPDIEERINRRVWGVSVNNFGKYSFTNKVMLFFLVNLISAMGPITIEEIVGITNDTIKYKDKKNLRFIISVGVALNIFNVLRRHDEEYFTCVDYEKLFRHSSTQVHLNRIQTGRARSLSFLMRIDSYRDTLKWVIENAS